MSIIWTLTACFLGAEIVIIILFLLPFLSAKIWRTIFNLRIFAFISDYMLYLVLGLFLLFADAVNRLRKSNNDLESFNKNEHFANADFLELKRLNLFLAQRNFYISGFSLFLWLVLNRLVKLITAHGQLQVEYEATKKQAASATEAAEKFLNESRVNEENTSNEINPALEKLETELEKTKKSLSFTISQLKTSQADIEAMKSQSEATKREYDRLLNELHPAEEPNKDD